MTKEQFQKHMETSDGQFFAHTTERNDIDSILEHGFLISGRTCWRQIVRGKTVERWAGPDPVFGEQSAVDYDYFQEDTDEERKSNINIFFNIPKQIFDINTLADKSYCFRDNQPKIFQALMKDIEIEKVGKVAPRLEKAKNVIPREYIYATIDFDGNVSLNPNFIENLPNKQRMAEIQRVQKQSASLLADISLI